MLKSDIVMGLLLLISIIGWWKSERFPKIASYFIIILMICLVGFQIYDSHLLAKNLQQKDQQIVLLEKKANQAERGIIHVYDFHGRRRINSPGHIGIETGTEQEKAFAVIQQLYNDKKDTELVIFCYQQIEKTPEWLTPYFYLGVAYMNLGDKENAKKQLQYVVTKAAGDPEYKQAGEFLQQLQQ